MDNYDDLIKTLAGFDARFLARAEHFRRHELAVRLTSFKLAAQPEMG